MRRHLSLALAFPMICLLALSAPAAPLDDIAEETVSGRQTSPPNYGWNYGYDIAFEDSSLKISMDIKLEFDDGISAAKQNALKDAWEAGIENTWNDKFDIIKDGTWRFPIKVEVNWVDPHHTVRVRTGPARSTSNTWDTEDNGNVAAHEFGHLLGLFDEYTGGALDPSSTIDGTSIMGVSPTATGAPPKSRHYEGFRSWLAGKSPTQTFTIEPHVAGSVEVIGALSNFDVRNNSGMNANDFELELGSVEPEDIKGTFPGFGDTDPEITDTGDGVKIRWAGNDIGPDSLEHFGVRFKDGTQAESAKATWTKDGSVIALNAGTGIDQYYTAAAGLPDGLASTIRNTSDQPLLVAFRHSEILDTPLLLPDLNAGLALPWLGGGLFTDPILLEPGQFIVDIFDLTVPGSTDPGSGVGRSVVTQIEVIDPLSQDLLTFFTNQGTASVLPPDFDLVLGDFDLNGLYEPIDIELIPLALSNPQLYLQQNNLLPEDLLLLGDFNGDGVFDELDVTPLPPFPPLDDTLGFPQVWGDLDANDLLDLNDLANLALAIEQGLIGGPWDYDLDGVTTAGDTQFWVEQILGSALGDANLDFNVDLIDLSILATHFAQAGFYGQGDFNGDGVIDLIDLSILATNFGFAGGTILPEPGVAILLSMGLFAIGRGSRSSLSR
ncbi:hypothetical protein [Mucisphaera sp.]|uniref:hypothetical protein n=1 Tax=Mucisphaera sp. TaxID=2913024 RepID=UPI003D1348E3